MKVPARSLSLVVALCLLLPAALAAAQACGMADCAMERNAADAHACCPQPDALLEAADCCLEAPDDPAEAPQAPARAGAPEAVLAGAAVEPLAQPVVVALAAPEAAGSPPGGLLARLCILRI